MKFSMQDVPLISNIGSEFQLKPINFLSHLGSLDVVDQFEFEACMPRYGAGQFDYSWNDSGFLPHSSLTPHLLLGGCVAEQSQDLDEFS